MSTLRLSGRALIAVAVFVFIGLAAAQTPAPRRSVSADAPIAVRQAPLEGPAAVVGQNAPAPPAAVTQAPLNPEFVEYTTALREGRAVQMTTGDGHALGLLPAPRTLSHLTAQPVDRSVLGALPASYDLRTLGKVTSVKNQGSCGSCWTFGTFGALESELLTAETRDFSENNLKNLSGFDYSPCFGGNAYMAMAYLARWSGPINETDDPYLPVDYNNSPATSTPQKHVQDVILIPGRTSSTDNSALKNALMTYGALSTSMNWVDASYNLTTGAYYYTGTGTNHAVTLVGWDDNYSASNFNSPYPLGNGAFLIKNSWGAGWGLSGYFWISYYDTAYARYQSPQQTGESFAYVGNEATTNYSRKYEYDPLGWVSSVGLGSTSGWFANVFTAVATEPLQAVSLYVSDNNSPYTIKIYTGVSSTPTSGTLALTTSGTFATAGYHTVVLPSTVPLINGQNFSAVVYLNTPNDSYPIPFEYAYPGYSGTATASPGQSYYSSDGSTWSDFTDISMTANACIKAFTASSSSATTTDPRHRSQPQPRRSFSSPSLEFSATRPGLLAKSQTATLTNVGDAPLAISSIQTAGDYRQRNSCGASLAPGQSCTITVWFKPTRTGINSGELLIYDNADNSPGRMPLIGSTVRWTPREPVDARSRLER